jgi:hypothetical protein
MAWNEQNCEEYCNQTYGGALPVRDRHHGRDHARLHAGRGVLPGQRYGDGMQR